MRKGTRKPRRECSIVGCTKPSIAHGWCRNHYNRWWHHGDPLAGRVAPGVALDWMQAMIGATTATPVDECLTDWPFARHKGYAQMKWQGRMQAAHVAVLELTGRPKPAPDQEGRHLCGNGHLGCLNPAHLAWGTHQENVDDMVGHGRANQGTRSPTVKLTETDVRAIRASTEPQDTLAARYGIAQSTVSKIKLRYRWAHLPD